MAKLVTVPQLAEKLSLSLPGTYRLIQNREIEFYRLGKRRIAFSEEQIETFLEKSRVEADVQIPSVD